MEEEDGRLALLQTELNNLQGAIRNMDSIILQIRGWCVTAALAIGGLAVTYHKPALLVVGEGAIAGFFLMNCQFRMFQRSAYRRNEAIDSELKKVGIIQFLRGAGTLEVVGTAIWGYGHLTGMSSMERIRRGLPDFWFEASRPSNFSLYLFLAVCLLAEFIILT
jgi:hypothetical protein